MKTLKEVNISDILHLTTIDTIQTALQYNPLFGEIYVVLYERDKALHLGENMPKKLDKVSELVWIPVFVLVTYGDSWKL